MKFILLVSFDNYIPAHIALGRLKEEYINCYLQDEYSVTIDPFLSNAIGGIKLMVAETQAERALEILNSLQE
jgi:Putative prokaryotic signal transducing protein